MQAVVCRANPGQVKILGNHIFAVDFGVNAGHSVHHVFQVEEPAAHHLERQGRHDEGEVDHDPEPDRAELAEEEAAQLRDRLRRVRALSLGLAL